MKPEGKDAPGGAYGYLAHGRMIGGFALVAHPARYGVSGVMTFIVNQDGGRHDRRPGSGSVSEEAGGGGTYGQAATVVLTVLSRNRFPETP